LLIATKTKKRIKNSSLASFYKGFLCLKPCISLREEGDGDDDTEAIGREPLCEIGEDVVDLDAGLEKSARLADKKKYRNKPPYVVVSTIELDSRRFSNG